MNDLTEEEESKLPLPEGWIQSIEFDMTDKANGYRKVYKNLVSGMEYEEHPLIIEGLALAKKTPLPYGWTIQSLSNLNGSKDFFYYNADLGVSKWDPPHLKRCLKDVLDKYGLDSAFLSPKDENQHDSFINSSFQNEDEKDHLSTENDSVSGGLFSGGHLEDFIEQEVAKEFQQLYQDASEGHPFEEGQFYDEHPREVGDGAKKGRINKTMSELRKGGRYQQRLAPSISSPSAYDTPLHVEDLTESIGEEGFLGNQQVKNRQTFRPHSTVYDEEKDMETPQAEEPIPQEEPMSPLASDQASIDEHNQNEAMTAQEDLSQGNRTDHSVVVKKGRDWEELLHKYMDKGSLYFDKLTHRMQKSRPPISLTGIGILRTDLEEANERVHHLLLSLKALLCGQRQIECTFHYHDSNGPTNRVKSDITLASDIVTSLRQNPEFVIQAMAHNNLPKSRVMLHIAFIALHRLLHPFSCDDSMTTALLLQGINFQLDELAQVEQIFSQQHSQMIISRALFISDPETAIQWDPLEAPMPLIPATSDPETLLCCLLRCYAIRRDVGAYFKSIWRPLVPSLVALISPSYLRPGKEFTLTESVSNYLIVASRLLNRIFDEGALRFFPPSAIAICKALDEIGGHTAIHYFLLNILLLPNLLRMLAGDHEGIEAEDFVHNENIGDVVNKYFDTVFWCSGQFEEETDADLKALDNTGDDDNPGNPSTASTPSQSINPIQKILWMVWRLYSCAYYLDERQLTRMSLKSFLAPRWKDPDSVNTSGFSDSKLRNYLMRLHRRMEKSCSMLVSLSHDQDLAFSSMAAGRSIDSPLYNGDETDPKRLINHHTDTEASSMTNQKVQNSKEIQSRRAALLFKPSELLNLSIVSRRELEFFFTEVGFGIEAHGDFNGEAMDSLYSAISEFLNRSLSESISMRDDDAEQVEAASALSQEQFMQLTFLYSSTLDPPTSSSEFSITEGDKARTQEEIQSLYRQLTLGLRMANSYEDQLIRMIHQVLKEQMSSLYDLCPDVVDGELAPDGEPPTEAIYFSMSHALQSSMDPQLKPPHGTQYSALPLASSGLEALATKHTAGSRMRHKGSHFGLHETRKINAFPLFSNPTSRNGPGAHQETHKSLKEIQQEVINSYRFGSASLAASVGTSLGRKHVLSPKVKKGSVPNTPNPSGCRASVQRTAYSKYTQIQIEPNASFLAPTTSFLNHQRPLPETQRDKEVKFMASLREHKVIPTEEFRKRYFQARKHYQIQRFLSTDGAPSLSPLSEDGMFPAGYEDLQDDASRSRHSQISRSYSNGHRGQPTLAAANLSLQAPKPFPESLRNRVRVDNDGGSPPNPTQPSQLMHEDPASNMLQSDTREIIQEYMAIFGGPQSSARPSSSTHSQAYIVPEVPSDARFIAPTQSLLQRNKSSSPPPSSPGKSNLPFSSESRFAQERFEGIVPQLRRYVDTSRFVPSGPFTPTKNKLYRPSGQRVRRLPEFLHKEGISEEEYILTRSRSGSRSNSRSNSRPSSRPSSPLRAIKSGANFPFDNEVHSSQNQQSEEEYKGHNSISEVDSLQLPCNTHNSANVSKNSKQIYMTGSDAEIPILRPAHFSNISNSSGLASQSQDKSKPQEPVEERKPMAKKPAGNSSTPPLQAAPKGSSLTAVGKVDYQGSHPNTAEMEPQQQHQAPKEKNTHGVSATDMANHEAQHPVNPPRVSSSVQRPSLTSKSSPKGNHELRKKLSSMRLKSPLEDQAAQATQQPTDPSVQSFDQSADNRSSLATESPKDQQPYSSAYSIHVEQDSEHELQQKGLSNEYRNSLRYSPLQARNEVFEDLRNQYQEAQQAELDSSAMDSDDDDEVDEGEGDDMFPEDMSPSTRRMIRKGRLLKDQSEQALARQKSKRELLQKRNTSFKVIRKASRILDNESLQQVLHSGFSALKYGRAGGPKYKIIRWNDESNHLEWTQDSSRTGPSLSSFIASLGTSQRSKVSGLPLDSITEVRRGIHTDVLARAGLIDPLCAISIITPERSLDLTLQDQSQRDMVFRGLKSLLSNRSDEVFFL